MKDGDSPYLDSGFKGWIYEYCRDNYWRAMPWYEFDDLLQDAYLTYTRICRRYPQIKRRSHLMRLFQTAFRRYLITLSNKNDVEVQDLDELIGSDLEGQTGSAMPDQLLRVLISEIPRDVYAVSMILTRDLGDCDPYERLMGLRETTNEYLRRLLGYNYNVDLVARVHQYFGAV